MHYMPRRRARVKSQYSLPLFDWAASQVTSDAGFPCDTWERRLAHRYRCSPELAKAVIAAWDLGGRRDG